MTIKTNAAAWRVAAVTFAAIAATVPVRAADPIFPPASRLGLVPPPGMKVAQTFPGFEDPANDAAILISTLPAAAFAGLESNQAEDQLKKDGITVEKREHIKLPIGNAILLVGTQLGRAKQPLRKWLLAAGTADLTAIVSVQEPLDSKAYPESVVRASLATLTERQSVPQSELLKLLPFTVGNLVGFRVQNVIPGRALLLTDTPEFPHLVATDGIPAYDLKARAIIAALPGGPSDKSQRANFARLAFSGIGGLKDVSITMSEPVRIDNQEAFETVAHATERETGIGVMVVQWLRFGRGGFLQIIGICRADIWDSELPRLQTMRDSIQIR